jgi:hypothetical protein
MPKSSRLIGLWMLCVAMSLVALPHREMSAAPAPPPACQKCACKAAPIWKLGNTYYGLRQRNEDGTTSPANHMYTYPANLVPVTPKSWSQACDAGNPTQQTTKIGNQSFPLMFENYDYRTATPDCTYGGTDGALIACTEGTGASTTGARLQQVLCK